MKQKARDCKTLTRCLTLSATPPFELFNPRSLTRETKQTSRAWNLRSAWSGACTCSTTAARVACYYQAYRGNDQPIVPLCLWPCFARDHASVINLTSAFLSIPLLESREDSNLGDANRWSTLSLSLSCLTRDDALPVARIYPAFRSLPRKKLLTGGYQRPTGEVWTRPRREFRGKIRKAN